MPGRRLFVAVPLPPRAVDEIVALLERVRGVDPGDRRRDVRWVRLESLHLTLRFLGPTLEPRVVDVREAVRRVADAGSPGEVAIAGAGAFPDTDRPRAIWLGVARGAGLLGGLAESLDRELVAAGWPPADRPFRPHLTVARSDGLPRGRTVAERLISEASGFQCSFTADRITLFESRTGGGAARYDVIDAFPLV